jgi:hypothetical protein
MLSTVIRAAATLLLLAQLGGCGDRRSDGTPRDAGGGRDTGTSDASRDGGGGPGDAGPSDGGRGGCEGPLVVVREAVLIGHDEMAYALGPAAPQLIAQRPGEPFVRHLMSPGMPEVLPAAMPLPFEPSNPAAQSHAAAIDGARLAVVFQHGTMMPVTELALHDASDSTTRLVPIPGLRRYSADAAGKLAAGGDRIALVGFSEGSANVLVRVIDREGAFVVDTVLNSRSGSAVQAAADGFTLAVNDRVAALVEVYHLDDAGLSLTASLPTPGPTSDVALAGDRVGTILVDALLVIEPDGSSEEHVLPIRSGSGALIGLGTPLGDAFALQVGKFLYLGVVRDGVMRWEQGIEAPIAMAMHGDARNAGVYALSRLESTIQYLGLRCP